MREAVAIETPERWQAAHDAAWRYFALHAGQRLVVFNFFVVAVGLIGAGMATALRGGLGAALVGVALGLVLVALAFVAWKLDQRTSFLVKHAEGVMALAEAELLPPAARTVCAEPAALAAARGQSGLRGVWTYGTAFRALFAIAALFGIVSSVLCAQRAAEILGRGRPASVGTVAASHAPSKPPRGSAR